jgi:hypothetical protein
MAAFGYCHVDRDPSILFANTAPSPRQAVWHEGEVVRLIKRAWREGFSGLAACLAVAWDSQLSPVDARTLRADQLRRDPIGSWFDVARAKTGRAAKATLSKRAERVLRAYLALLPVELMGPIFRNRSGRPYSKDTLGDDFMPCASSCSASASPGNSPISAVPAPSRLWLETLPQRSSRPRWRTAFRSPTCCTRPMGQCSSRRCATPSGDAAGRSSENKKRMRVARRRPKNRPLESRDEPKPLK